MERRSLKTRAVRTVAVVPLSLVGVFGILGVLGCNDLSRLAGSQALPSGSQDPNAYHTAAGALGLYQAALATAEGASTSGGMTMGAFWDVATHAGLMSDELNASSPLCSLGNTCPASSTQFEDARQFTVGQTNGPDVVYTELQKARGDAEEAIGGLAAWAPSSAPALRGTLYALIGYAEIDLADLFCSGVPLSTLDFNANFTYHAGSTTAQVYQDAIGKLDTAFSLGVGNAPLQNWALVGKGRALLDLDSVAAAAQAVAGVPDGFTYQEYLISSFGSGGAPLFSHVADRKGENGLSYISSSDPRTAGVQDAVDSSQDTVPLKYGGFTDSIAPLVLGDWIEARLIRAEAALQAGDVATWLGQLNTLRQTATVPGQTGPLGPLTDPGVGLSGTAVDTARVNLLFRERAYWLYLTGHRLGDLRRLIRQYREPETRIFPTGPYDGGLNGINFGSYVSALIPPTESVNQKFTGCLSLDD